MLEVGLVMMATGRKPKTAGVGLEVSEGWHASVGAGVCGYCAFVF